MFETKLDCKLVQILMFVVVPFPHVNWGPERLFEFISPYEYDFDLTQDSIDNLLV